MTYSKTKNLQIEGGYPPFSYAGSRCTRLLPSGIWIHATGNTAVGMTGTEYCGEIWSLDLKAAGFAWKKLDTEASDCDHIKMLVVVSDDGLLYIIDPKRGVLVGKLKLE